MNKTYSSITIDPTKITEGDMKGFLARVCGDEATMDIVTPGYFFIQNVKDGSTVPNNAYMFAAFAEEGPYYLSLYGQTMSSGGPKPISTDGWYTLENEDWIPLTESITVTVPSEITAIESINDDFNTTLNGTVITGVESTSPKPVGLNPWVVDRSYEIGSGDKFLFDTSTDPLEFLKSLETAGEGGTSLYSNGMYSLVSSGSPDHAAIVFAMVISGKYFLLGNIGAGMYGYASDDFSQEGISFKKGWNCPENGIVEVTSNVGHVGELSPITGWNGVFTGFEKKQS